MKDFQAKRKVKRAIFSWPVVVLLVGVNLLLLKSNVQLYGKERYTADNEAQAQKEYRDVVSRQNSLTADVARLSTSEGVDLELRRKYQVVKPGEETVVIVTSAVATTSEKLEEKPGMWENPLHWLGL